MKRCPECGQEMRMAHGMWSHDRKGHCKIQFIRATEAERAAEGQPALPICRRTWAETSSPATAGRFGYLAARPEAAGQGS